MADGVGKPMRVDTSLLDGINAANAAAKSSSKLKSSPTTTSFSSALKSAEEKETTKAVPGTSYHEILTGPRAGMYLNKSGNARDGEAFILVKHDGREDHIYGTGKNRKVISHGAEKSDAKDAADDKKSSSTVDGLRDGEKAKRVEGRAYHDILNGPRAGMFLNSSGNVRDGQAFVLVNRDGREYHIYGTGKNRTVVSVKAPTDNTSTETPAASAPPASSTESTPETPKTGSSLVDTTT
jgi:hypothetical protein